MNEYIHAAIITAVIFGLLTIVITKNLDSFSLV